MRSGSSAGAQPDRLTGPVRTCVGCRARAAKSTLVRIGLDRGQPILDRRGRALGRGAYVHPRRACIERLQRALRAGKFGRALRIAAHSSDTLALQQALAALSESLPEAASPRPSTHRPRNNPIAERMSSTTIETSPRAHRAPAASRTTSEDVPRSAAPGAVDTYQARGQR